MSKDPPHRTDAPRSLFRPAALRAVRWLIFLVAVLSLPMLACGTFTTNTADSVRSEPTPRVIPTSTPIIIPTPVLEVALEQPEQGLGGTSASPNNPGIAVANSNVPLVIGERAQVVAGSGINVREFSSTTAREIGKLSQGAIVEILEGPFTNEDLFWWRIRTLDELYEGMVAEGQDGLEYLMPAANTRVPMDRDPRQDDIVRVTESLNIRRDPGVSSPQILTLEAGTKFLVIDGPVHQGEYNWYKLRNESGTLEGWSAAVIQGRRTLVPLE